ncbi:hypothetical protein B0H19DRAFT_1261131 [Mycena capillaripes]|nr:hypothetical protein B0H19DRAFT_1261131 [Mycena capillaripes]
MAETLGIVATLLQLIDTVLKARDYIQDFCNAPEEQRKLLSEMEDLRSLLEELDKRIDANPSSSMLQRMNSPLNAFKPIVEEFTKKRRPGDGRLSKFSKQLSWMMWKKQEAKEYLGKFEQFKALLNSWLLLDIGDMGQQHHDNDSHAFNPGTVTEIGSTIVDQRRQMESAERKKIIHWLSPINFFLRQADVFQSREPDTGGWLLVDPRFQEWEAGQGRSLWCHGIPGAGKTVLVSMVVDHLGTQSLNKLVSIACVYLNHKEAQSPADVLAGVWRQLVLGRELTFKVQKLYEQHSEKGTPATLGEIRTVLDSAIAEFAKVYIVVDAVDEYPEDRRRVLLEYLAAMGPTVNLFITSRPHVFPSASLPNLETLEIRADADDIRRFVDAQIHVSSRLARHVEARPELQAEIQSEVSGTVDGMFLLAKLHMESLGTKSSIKAVREALKHLPKDLKDTYDNAIRQIEIQCEEDKNIARSALTWVANARRPLTVAELQTALAIEPETQQLDKENILDIYMILSVCAGLVIVDEQLCVVRLVHYTTQEYLDSIQAQKFPHAQTEIALSLLTFLSFTECVELSHTQSADRLPVLFDYCQYSLTHVQGKAEETLKKILLDFLGKAPGFRKCALRVWHSAPWNFLGWPQQPSLLWIAAAANLCETAKFLLNHDLSLLDIDEEGSTALQVASYHGHLPMVQLLVESGADVNMSAGRYGHALQATSVGGNSEIVEFLLDTGANVNALGGRYGSALQAAASEGHDKIVRILVNRGAAVNVQGGRYGTSLQAGALQGHKNIVQHLLQQGADVDAQGGRYGNALQAASAEGHESIVHLLLDAGATVNAQGGRYGSALTGASLQGQEAIVQLLLRNGAEVNIQGGRYGSAVQAASLQDHKDVVRLLLENGADVNAQGGEFGSGLYAGSSRGVDIIHRNLDGPGGRGFLLEMFLVAVLVVKFA